MLMNSQIIRVAVIYFCIFIDKNCFESSPSTKETGKVFHFKIFSPKYKYSIKEIFPSNSSLIVSENKQTTSFSDHFHVQNENLNQSKKNILASSNSDAQSIPSVLINLGYRSAFSPFFKLFEKSNNSNESTHVESEPLQNIRVRTESNSTSYNQELSLSKKLNSVLGYLKKFLFQQLGFNNSNHSSSMMGLTSENRSLSENSLVNTSKFTENISRVNVDSSFPNVTYEQNTVQERTMRPNQTSESINNTTSFNKMVNEWNSTTKSLYFSENAELMNLTEVQSNQNSSSIVDLDANVELYNFTNAFKDTFQTEKVEHKNVSFLQMTTSTKLESLSNNTFVNNNQNSTEYATNSIKHTGNHFGSKPNRSEVSFKIKNLVELFKNSIKSQIKNSKLKISFLKRPNSTAAKKSQILNNFNLVNENLTGLYNYFNQTTSTTAEIKISPNMTKTTSLNWENLSKNATNKVENSQENINQPLVYQTNTTSILTNSSNSTTTYETKFYTQTENDNFANSSMATLHDRIENEDLIEMEDNQKAMIKNQIDNNLKMLNYIDSNQNSLKSISNNKDNPIYMIHLNFIIYLSYRIN